MLEVNTPWLEAHILAWHGDVALEEEDIPCLVDDTPAWDGDGDDLQVECSLMRVAGRTCLVLCILLVREMVQNHDNLAVWVEDILCEVVHSGASVLNLEQDDSVLRVHTHSLV